MTVKFKPGDKVWVKARIADPGSNVLYDSEFVLVPHQKTANPYWLRISHTLMRPRVKRKKPTSPWQPIETAPKDGTPVLARLGQPGC